MFDSLLLEASVALPEDWSPLWVSMRTAIAATLLAVVLGVWAARWMLAGKGRVRSLFDGIFMLPLVLPPTVVGFLLLLLLGRNSLIGQVLNSLGISVVFTWAAVVLAATVVSFPLMYRSMLAALQQIDEDMANAARTLGASEWQIFWQILLPLSWPGLLAGTILSFARSLGEFGATLMVGGSILGVTRTVPIALFFAAESGEMNVALAWVLIMVAIALGAIALINLASRQTRWRKQQMRRPSRWIERGFNWIYFGRFNVNLSQVEPVAFKQTGRTEQPELTVDISSELASFRLQTRFRACGSPLGILGASGSGKSLTLLCIAGLETPAQGRIVLNGRVLFDAKKSVNVNVRDRKVGFVFQNYALFPHLTVAQNIAFGMRAIARDSRLGVVASYLKQMGLGGLGDRYAHQLSGGQQQRVALARALAIQPDMLLLDEPLSALDTYLRSRIEKLLIETLADYPGITLLVTHKLEEAYRVCPRLIVLSQGQILAANTREEIFWHPPTFEVAKVTECKNFSRALAVGKGQIEALDWDCRLETAAVVSVESGWIGSGWTGSGWLGIRAHHIQFLAQPDERNTFPAWVAMASQTQHRVTLYLKLHQRPVSTQDYHLQAEVYREKWNQLKTADVLFVKLDPTHLILMRE